MGHRELVVPGGPVVRHEQPAREALVGVVAAVAGRRARHLPVVDQRVAEQEGAEGGDAVELLAEGGLAQPQRGAGVLHHGLEVVVVGPE